MAIDKVIGQSINDGVEEVEMVEMVAELKVVQKIVWKKMRRADNLSENSSISEILRSSKEIKSHKFQSVFLCLNLSIFLLFPAKFYFK